MYRRCCVSEGGVLRTVVHLNAKQNQMKSKNWKVNDKFSCERRQAAAAAAAVATAAVPEKRAIGKGVEILASFMPSCQNNFLMHLFFCS